MSGYYSNLRVDIPVQCGISEPADLSYELDVLLRAARAVHLAAITAYGSEGLTVDNVAGLGLTDLYQLTDKSRLVAVAATAITANRVVGLYVSGSTLYARHYSADPSLAYSNVAGVAASSVAAGEKLYIYTTGAIVGGFSGLVPGKHYKAVDNGQIVIDTGSQSAYPSGTNLLSVGIAVSATQLRIKSEGRQQSVLR